MAPNAVSEAVGREEQATSALNKRQYAAWGVVVQTKDVRAAHVANGVIQLLRLMPSPPKIEPVDPVTYVRSIKDALRIANLGPGMSDAARALCVYKSKAGPIRLDASSGEGSFRFVAKGREHLARILDPSGGAASHFSERAHRAIADALNADHKVMAAGGSDPTTTGLTFAGFTDTHTLKGMHAVTFLGLLSATASGRDALRRLYDAARAVDDPHSSLVRLLGLAAEEEAGGERAWPSVGAAGFEGAFPAPQGAGWDQLAEVAGSMASNITRRHEHGATKAETMMSLVDLALLLLSTRMLRWEGELSSPPRLLLTICSLRNTTALQQAIARAQDSLRLARVALDDRARDAAGGSLIRPGKRDREAYLPSSHATHLAAAGGWLFPLDGRGGAQQYLCPGPRQLVTLAHALVPPGDELPWSTFVACAERAVGLSLGGADDGSSELALRMGGLAATLREAAKTNQEQFIALGLARRESDNVVIVDGGAR